MTITRAHERKGQHPSPHALLRDARGLGTFEYAVLFVVIVVGALALWTALGRSLHTNVEQGTATLARSLARANREGAKSVGTAADFSARSGSPLATSPGAARAAHTGGTPTTPAASGPAQSEKATTPAASGPAQAETHGAGPAASAHPDHQAAAVQSPSASGSSQPSAASGWTDKKIGTGGKVAVVAGGAVAGAALAAGASWGTAYATSLLCGPGAPACAGAVTLALAGAGVYALATGGFSQLKGAFSRTFSADDATLGDALTVGTTLGGLAYGVAEAAGATRVTAVASSAGQTARSSEVSGSVAALGRGGASDVYHATTSHRATQGVLDGIHPDYLNAQSRFGKAFYVAEKPETALAELAHHKAVPTQGIRFSADLRNARVLDLSDPSVAAKFGYSGGPITSETQGIGARALEQGYSAIRYPSLRGDGNNLAILKDFNDILKPQMVSPVP